MIWYNHFPNLDDLGKPFSAYQDAFLTPGIWPLYAKSRKQIRQMPYLRRVACGRPQILQRLYALTANFGVRLAFKTSAFFAMNGTS